MSQTFWLSQLIKFIPWPVFSIPYFWSEHKIRRMKHESFLNVQIFSCQLNIKWGVNDMQIHVQNIYLSIYLKNISFNGILNDPSFSSILRYIVWLHKYQSCLIFVYSYVVHFPTMILRGWHSGTSLKFKIDESIVWPLWKNEALSIFTYCLCEVKKASSPITAPFWFAAALVNTSETEHTAHISHTLIRLKIVSNPERLKLKKFDLHRLLGGMRHSGCSV